MKTSPAGIALVKKYEGLRLKRYKDSARLDSIGWGHLILPHEDFTEISPVTAGRLLRRDLATAEHAVGELVTVPLSEPRRDALISFTFNLGVGALKRSTLLQRVNEGRHAEVPEQFCRWIKAAGKPLIGLARRRIAEAEMYLS